MHQILKFDLSPKDVKIKTILNKEFLELEMYAISDIYPNRNTSTFTEQSLIDSKHTCYNKPILGCFNVVADDFEEHNGDLKYDRDFQEEYWDYTSDKTEKILGVIRESDNVEVVNYENQNWLKIIQSYDEDFKISDYSPSELEELINNYKTGNQKFKDNYFSYYNDVKSSSRKKQDW